MLEPVRRIGKGEELGAIAVAQTFLSHFWEQERIAFAPQDACGDVHGAICEFGAKTEERAVPVYHGCQCTRLRQRRMVLSEIFRGKSAGAAGSDE